MNQIKCAIRGCDRLASMSPDDQGDLCGACRDAEFALGREPQPDPTMGTRLEIAGTFDAVLEHIEA